MTASPNPSKVRIACFAGSSRKDSCNKKLAQLAAQIIQDNNAKATYIDLGDYPMPLYDADDEIELGLPKNAAKLKAILKDHHAYIIASPEYNSSISGLTKNTIDWLSRSDDANGDLSAFTGKCIAIVSASPGHLGGLRNLVHLRAILSNIGSIVIPNQLAISNAYSAFSEEGLLKEERQMSQLSKIVSSLIDVTQRLL